MNDSIFDRVFSYRERANVSPLENFLIEILAFCLANDTIFAQDFYNLIGLEIKDARVETQTTYEGLGRPDIEISNQHSICLIECKVESDERENQLLDYIKILDTHKKNHKNKSLVFLTKYYEYRYFAHDNIKFIYLRWYEINQLINDKHNLITQQLKQFLINNDMDKIKNFTIQDLLVMKSVGETISKMDELLEQFKPYFEKNFGGYSKESSRSTRLVYNNYSNHVILREGKLDYCINIGFFWWWHDVEIPVLGVTVEVAKKKFENSKLPEFFKKNLITDKNWEYEEDDKAYWYSSYKSLSEFISKDDDNIPAMKKFLTEQLDILINLKKTNPEYFKPNKE